MAFAQSQHATDQLALLRAEWLAVERAVQFDRQLGRPLLFGLQPLEAEDFIDALRILMPEHRQSHDKGDKPQRAQADRLTRSAPFKEYKEQCQRRQQARPAPQQTRTERSDNQPDQACQNQQQACEY